jgi:hypothetical protein
MPQRSNAGCIFVRYDDLQHRNKKELMLDRLNYELINPGHQDELKSSFCMSNDMHCKLETFLEFIFSTFHSAVGQH